MSYEVIARKWRPQSFQELIGQDHISVTLINALRNNRLPQALLFTGPRGTGKTSSARILSKSLRCPNAADFVPCNTCSSCQEIAAGRSLDVVEIDGASNNGVDAIRDLRNNVGYMPSSGRYKVYIIDEVHMLSTSAFNALLKTLEEPPAHVVFIMATTEVQKIPNTILSRCQRFDFRRIPSRQIAQQLQTICEKESVQFEPEALWLIARQADGSMRDSQSLLDQVVTFCDNNVTLQKTVEVLGLTDRAVLLETLEALIQRDTQKVIDVIEKILTSGYDPRVYAQDLLEEFRHALLVRLCGDNAARIVDLADSEVESLKNLTSSLSEEDIHLLFDMALKGVNDLVRAQDTRIVLEMLLLRMASAPRVENLMQWLSGSGSASRPAPERRAAPAATKRALRQTAPAPQTAAPPKRTSVTSGHPAATAPETEESADQSNAHRANDPWFRFVGSVKKANGLLGAMLENTHLLGTEEDKLTIGVPKRLSFLFDKINEPDNIKRIEKFLETFWSKKYSVTVKLAGEKTESLSPKAVAENQEQEKKKTVEQQVEQHPFVRSAQNVFKTQIKSIKESS